MLSVVEKLTLLRRRMRAQRLAAYLVPSTDPHQSEYVPACWQRRQWLSGFTGSAGDLVVTENAAGLWTDGRYFVQAKEELRGSGIRLFRQGLPAATLLGFVLTGLASIGLCVFILRWGLSPF